MDNEIVDFQQFLQSFFSEELHPFDTPHYNWLAKIEIQGFVQLFIR